MFKMSEIKDAVNEIHSNKNPDLSAAIFYDTSDSTIWVDFLMQGESKRYHSKTIKKIILDEYFHFTSGFKKINSDDLAKFLEEYLELSVDYDC